MATVKDTLQTELTKLALAVAGMLLFTVALEWYHTQSNMGGGNPLWQLDARRDQAATVAAAEHEFARLRNGMLFEAYLIEQGTEEPGRPDAVR